MGFHAQILNQHFPGMVLQTKFNSNKKTATISILFEKKTRGARLGRDSYPQRVTSWCLIP